METNWSLPELEMRFLDYLKIYRRQQMMQSMTFMKTIATFFIKNGEQSFFEEVIEDIKMINENIGESRSKEEIEETVDDGKTDEEREQERKEKLSRMMARHKSFMENFKG